MKTAIQKSTVTLMSVRLLSVPYCYRFYATKSIKNHTLWSKANLPSPPNYLQLVHPALFPGHSHEEYQYNLHLAMVNGYGCNQRQGVLQSHDGLNLIDFPDTWKGWWQKHPPVVKTVCQTEAWRRQLTLNHVE